MSTAITKSQLSTILPTKLMEQQDKPRLKRSSSIDTIKRINTYICSPQSYILPVILTNWLKTGQNGLHSSTEKTIFMFRSFIFGTVLFKFLLKTSEPAKLNLQNVLQQLQEVFLRALQSTSAISLVFKLTVSFLILQMGLCMYLLSQSFVPLGFGFLMVCLIYIAYFGYRINRLYLIKRDVKCKKH